MNASDSFIADRKAAVAKIQIRRPTDIKRLPWTGIHSNDLPCFTASTDFIINHAESVEDALQALEIMGAQGMGLYADATIKDLRDFLTGERPVHYKV